MRNEVMEECLVRVTGTLLLAVAVPAVGQAPPVSVHLTAQAVAAYTRVDPARGGAGPGETKIEEALVTARARAFGDHLQLVGTLDLEGLTLPNGVLTPGGWGRGSMSSGTRMPTGTS